MFPAEVVRRALLSIAAAALLTLALFYSTDDNAVVADTLPSRLSDSEFWGMITTFSEAGGYFRSDNILSNESGYQQVIPLLRKSVREGGVYLGVGPEQNFTYIVGLEPKMAFIIDIRRQNMLEHLLYKALMELSADRREFLSRLFSRQPTTVGAANSDAAALVSMYEGVDPDAELFETNLQMVLHHLEKTKGFELSKEDEEGIRHVYRAFYESGTDLSYTFLGGYGRGFIGMPTYGELMQENDGHTRNWNFLASESQYQMIRRLHNDNLIVPLVGDFAGPKALRSVAAYLKEHDAVVSAFYTSNVEQYLFQDDENWKQFFSNVETLPVDRSSMFIRYVLNGWRLNRRSRSLLAPISDVIWAYDRGRIRGYYDVIGMSH
jgi:hypothetical protein